MSDYSDILYDPKDHTHVSCVRDVSNADMVVLMIGTRFGGVATADSLPIIDWDAVSRVSSNTDAIAEKERMSVTQLEVLKAIEEETPLFAFVDDKVYADHHVYQANKSNGLSEKIKYPSLDKPETARYVFEFINLITHRTSNNAIIPYSGFADIEDHLIKQWSLLFQRLLREQRNKSGDQRRADVMIDQLEGLKAVVLQSIGSAGGNRSIAKSVLRFRRLADILLGLSLGPQHVDIFNFEGDFTELLNAFGIARVTEDSGRFVVPTYLILQDNSFYTCRLPSRIFADAARDWGQFKHLDRAVREAVLEGVEAASTTTPLIRYHAEDFDEYISRISDRSRFSTDEAPAQNQPAERPAPSPVEVAEAASQTVAEDSPVTTGTRRRKPKVEK